MIFFCDFVIFMIFPCDFGEGVRKKISDLPLAPTDYVHNNAFCVLINVTPMTRRNGIESKYHQLMIHLTE